MSFDTNLHTMMGVSPAAAVTRGSPTSGSPVPAATAAEGPSEMEAIMTQMAEARPEGPLLVAQSNAGLPHLARGQLRLRRRPRGDGRSMRAAARAGRRRDRRLLRLDPAARRRDGHRTHHLSQNCNKTIA